MKTVTWTTKTWTCPVCGMNIRYPDTGELRTFVHEDDGSHGAAVLDRLIPDAVWPGIVTEWTAPNPYSSIFARPHAPIPPPPLAQRVRMRLSRYRSRIGDAWRVLRGEAFVDDGYDY